MSFIQYLAGTRRHTTSPMPHSSCGASGLHGDWPEGSAGVRGQVELRGGDEVKALMLPSRPWKRQGCISVV